jgi:hypothetical protein
MRVFPCTGFFCVSIIAHAATNTVPAGGDLQAALNTAAPGDTIVLQAGAAYTGHFTLPNKPGAQYITVQSSALAQLPPDGIRVSPADAVNMPKLVTPDANSVLVATNGAHHFRFIGIEFMPGQAVYVNDLLLLGAYESSVSAMPQFLDFDRVYIHGDPEIGSKRGVALQGRDTTIRNSYLSDFKSTWQDTQAVAGWAGTGPYHILNNHLEASGESIGFGGAPPVVPNVLPSDIEIRGNHFYKPGSWRKGDPTFGGDSWLVKNHLEMKFGQRVIIDGNVFENNWVQADQNGFAVQFTVRDENGSVPWAVIQDVTFSNNIVRHSGAGINIYTTEGQGVRRITIKNNLFDDLTETWGGDGRLYQILGGSDSITIDHNTAVHGSYTIAFNCGPETNFVFTNNIDFSSSGIASGVTQVGTASLNYCAPGATVRGNVIGGAPASYPFPAGNFMASSLAAVGFVDAANGNYRLSSSSPYAKAATDGQDVGVNADAIVAAHNPNGTPIQVSAAPGASRVFNGGSIQFTADVAGSPNTAVSWSMNPALGTLTAAGLYTAPATLTSAQTIRITAASSADPSRSGSALVTIAPANPAMTPTITASPTTVSPNGSLTVSWSVGIAYGTDWIALYQTGTNNVVWSTVVAGQSSGAISLSAPAQPGQYQFRYLPQDGNTASAQSAIVTVVPYTLTVSSPTVTAGVQITVSWTALSGASGADTIVLSAAGSSAALWSQSTGGAAAGSFTIAAPQQTGQYVFRYLQNGSAQILTAGLTVGSAPTQATGASIWPNSAYPSIASAPLYIPIELGVKFRSDVAGAITGIRFYKGAGNNGTHTGSLWSSTGTLLATGTFVNETARGWQQLTFANPVGISANTTYIASYHTDTGSFAMNIGYFLTQGADAPPLHALRSGVDGGNGMYAAGSGGQFPSGASGNNYWVDVVFSAGASAPQPAPAPNPSPATPSSGSSIWPGNVTPSLPFWADDPVELGLKFRSDVAGTITGIRFYKSAGNTGTHTGSLWTSTGTLLATGTFTGETASGWQQLTFANPVAIAANTTYVASYHASIGFSADVGYFMTHGADNGPLHALQTGVDGRNGVFIYGQGGQFPANGSTGQNYWVDVIFNPGAATASTIWPAAVTPSIPFYSDQPIELGVKFRSDVAGSVTGVRFYKAGPNTGTHTGSLWSSSGTLLATGTFTNETAGGWQQLTFATPVMIAPNTTYVASYHTNMGFTVDVGYFITHGADSAPLHALKVGVDGANGVFIYGPGGQFPSNGSSGQNYWVDIIFTQ